jgi:hypothetical protein
MKSTRRQSLAYLGAIVLTTTILFILLLRFTTIPNKNLNGFLRHWSSPNFTKINEKQITSPLEQVCGATLDHIFFSVPNPQWLVMMNMNLTREDTIYFPVNIDDRLLTGHYYAVDSPLIYLYANNIPELFYSNLDGGHIKSVKLATSIFTKSTQVSPTSLVVRAFDSSRTQVFQKIDCQSGKIAKQAKIIPQNKSDMGFSTDGLLQYDKSSNRLLFVQFYQNKFYCLDSNLSLIYTGKTIDTTTTNNISIESIKIDTVNYLMPSKSRVTVNKLCSVADGSLFILSGLIADNENRNDFQNNNVIDIYSIATGKYKGSFYIPLISGNQIKSFIVTKSNIIALYKDHVATYELSHPVE